MERGLQGKGTLHDKQTGKPGRELERQIRENPMHRDKWPSKPPIDKYTACTQAGTLRSAAHTQRENRGCRRP